MFNWQMPYLYFSSSLVKNKPYFCLNSSQLKVCSGETTDEVAAEMTKISNINIILTCFYNFKRLLPIPNTSLSQYSLLQPPIAHSHIQPPKQDQLYLIIFSSIKELLLQYMQDNNLTPLQYYANAVTSILTTHNYQRIVLQIPKQMLPLSFQLAHTLRQQHPHCQFYTLYDSLKQSCCTDLLGAEHVGYDCLIHFGKACFSSQYLPNQHFIFQQAQSTSIDTIVQNLKREEILKELEEKGVKYVIVGQKYYYSLNNKATVDILQQHHIQMLRLPMHATQEDEYMAFGYHVSSTNLQGGNLLVIEDNQAMNNQEMTLCEQWSFIAKSLSVKIGQIFQFDFANKQIEAFAGNHNKRLMQRYSMISQLDDHNVFGIIVSNTATTFHQKALFRCQDVLKRHNKKTFTFMMNNLNEVKLGNFPEIEVYVIISCFNHSLFSIKDFHRLVVTPNDLEVAFQAKPFDHYDFDCHNTKTSNPSHKNKQANNQDLQLDKVHTEVVLASKIQTLDHYRDREFKGLEFVEKKEIKKASKGKIGVAQEYKNLE